jgi:hypothetical protein
MTIRPCLPSTPPVRRGLLSIWASSSAWRPSWQGFSSCSSLWTSPERPAGRVGSVLYGVLQAVDGVALKQAVDAWVSAPETEKAARFASAEAIRWLEWGVRSYHSFMLGLSFVLFASAIVRTARMPRPLGYLMGLSGVAYIVQGYVLGSKGFSSTNTAPQLVAYILVFVWSIWLLIIAWWMKELGDAPTR